MSPEAQAVWSLLRAYVAWIPGLRTSTGQIVSRGSSPGETPSKRIECPACKGTRETRVRGITTSCTECLDRKGRPTGRITVDGYTGRRKAGETRSERFTPQEMSQWESQTELALNRIEALLRMNEGSEAAHDAFTAAYDASEKMLDHDSFRDLKTALAWLRTVKPEAHSLIWQAVIYAPFGAPAGSVKSVCEGICEVLAQYIGKKVEVPSWARDAAEWRDRKESLHRGRTPEHEEQREERKREIHELRVNGIPVSSIAERFGLAKTQVYGILAGSVATVAA